MTITYKLASTAEEFEQIHRLNYQTFVQEIPQHSPNKEEKLIDRFHAQNTYLIACAAGKVVGMAAVRDQRPFSLDEKLEDLGQYLPAHRAVCEIRLLAVEKEYRQSKVFFGLAQFIANYCLQQGYDLVIMSGTVRQLKLYRHMGFVPFARLVGSEDAMYQPMYLTRETFLASLAGRLRLRQLSFLPGPVPISPEVAASLQGEAISHRSEAFQQTMAEVKEMLRARTGSAHVQILLGTGTLANDCIAAQLKLKGEKGLILANGEFGERLIDHAARNGLQYTVYSQPWGKPFEREVIAAHLQAGSAKWLWAVYGETSTGMLNDLQMLKELAAEHKALLCLDAISVLGVLPLDLKDVYLASGVSGKGLGSYTGLAFVFHQEAIRSSAALPRYLDLGLYQDSGSIPFSHSSNLLEALHTALKQNSRPGYQALKKNLSFLYREIESLGLPILVPEELSLPYIITIPFPDGQSAAELGDRLAWQGFKLHYESPYLRKRNWLQISILGRQAGEIQRMLKALQEILKD
ncbi:MAG: GNAT family N-acetyltransferase [Desulfitobacteriia bacterium]|jgi:aspartate aminotransferase-like enzyme/GNAT superfamily N-acetyltransferase